MHSLHPQPLGLTSFQRELWLSHLGLPEEHPGISCGGLFDLNGVPDPELTRDALVILVRHFPLLSATLRKTDAIFPVIVPGMCPEPDFSFLDFSAAPDPDRAARAWLAEFAEKPFNPLGGHLCRFALLRLSDAKSIFANRFFHLTGDGIVCVTHFNIMARIYGDLMAGRPVDLGPAQDWQDDIRQDQTHLASNRAASDKAFWRQQLADLPLEPIFTPRPGRPDRVETIARLEYPLPEAMGERLRDCATANKAGISDILMTLHLLALARLYDRDHLSIQIPLRFGERRDQRAFHGHRVNVVPFTIKIPADATFASLLADVQRQMRAFLRRAKTPFQLAFREGGDHPELSRIWDTHFNFIPMPADGELGGVGIRLATPITSRFEPLILGIYVIQVLEDQRLHLSIDYSRNHFSQQDVRRYLARLDLLLAEVMDHPQTLAGQGGILLPEEQAALATWQAGERLPFRQGSIPELFAAIATRHGDLPAVTTAEGQYRTYRTLADRAAGIAAWLAESGVGRGDVVAVLARRHPALAETILGIMQAGGVYLPVDPEYPRERIRHMLTDSGVRKLLTLEERDGAVAGDDFTAELPPRSLPPARPATAIAPEDSAYLIYTSGSTGTPKGVLVSHGGFVNMIQAQIRFFGITPADHVLHFASPSFDASLSEIFMALLAGARLAPASRTLIDEPWALRDFMAAQRISVATFPPSYLRLFNREPLPGLRVLITAGEPPLADDARHYAAELEYINAYGPTEASVCATLARLSPASLDQPGRIGRPIANTSAYILDRSGRRKAPGIPGELCLAGPGLATGYLNRRQLTAERFVTAGFDPGLRLYHTGDQAVWTPEGDILLLGRLDEQVKIRGHRVELGEVGAALAAHPEVAQAEVVAVALSGPQPDLVAFLIGEQAARQESGRLRDWLRQRLPDSMIPTRCHWLAAMPIAPTGKVDRRQLARLARQLTPEETAAEGPGSPVEEEIRAIFTAVLGEPVPSLAMDFFSLGGDSIRLVELGQRLSSSFGQSIATRQLLADSSVAGVAAWLRQEKNTAPAAAAATGGPLPLSQGQLQLWTLDRMRGPSAQYNMPFAVEIEAAALDEEALTEALARAVAAQPACRVVVGGEIDQPLLALRSNTAFHPERRDLRATPDPEAACRELFHLYCHQPFDLTELPLLRALLLRLADNRWRLLLVMHHLIGDGTSLHILLSDVFAALGGRELRQVAPRRLTQFAAAEQAYLQAPEAAEDLAWWQETLSPPPTRLDLGKHSRPLLKGGRGDLCRRELAAPTAARLPALAKTAATTRLGCFLALVIRFLALETDRADIAVGVPVGRRDDPGLHDVVGYFVNTVIVRSPRTDPKQDLVGQVREVAAALSLAVRHGRYPFPLLATTLGGERDPSRSPLVDILVTEIDEAALLAGVIPPEGMRLTPVDVSLQAAKLDFSFILHPRATGTTDLVLEYDTDITAAAEAESLLARFAAFLDTTVAMAGTADAVAEPPAIDPVAARVAAAWRRVLGVAEVTDQSNFFTDGGDSIKAIQIVGRLRREGITGLAPAQLFAQPTFAALRAASLATAPAEPAERPGPACRPGEAIPLLPMQQHLLRHQQHWHAFHMVLPLTLADRIDHHRLRRAVRELPGRHEAFRLAFTAAGQGTLLDPAAASVAWEECHAPANQELSAVVREAATRLFRGLAPAAGRLFGAVLAHHGDQRLLLIGGLHLVLDAVSLDILRRELAWYCREGAWPHASPGCGPLAWAAHLADQHHRPPWQQEETRWRQICATPAAALPGLKPEGVDRAGERIGQTRRLRPGRPLSANPRVELLSCLAQALHARGLTDPVLVTMEGHGREAAFPGLDVSQSVGWFTTTYPLPLAPAPRAGQAAETLAAWFDSLAAGGLGYGLLALADPEPLRYAPQISFNYLGRLADADEPDGFMPLPELAVPGELPGLLHPDFKSDAPLDLMVYATAADELVIHAYFSPRRLDGEWLAGLLAAWEEALLDQAAPPEEWLDLAATCRCRPEDIEAVYEPTSNQEAMLYQRQLDGPDSPTYTQQVNFRLQGRLDETALLTAWQLVCQRHAGLRSLFPTSAAGHPRWLVLRRSRTLAERIDLSGLPAAMQDDVRQQRLRQQRQQPFALDQGPLLAMQLFRQDDDCVEMSWCFHHILMDGWCIGILLRELFGAYLAISRHHPPELPPAPTLTPYQRWRERCDTEAACRYWREQLAGLARPTPVAGPPTAEDAPFTREEEEWRLPATTTAALEKIARRAGVSLATLLQAAWALLLGDATDSRDEVLFGLVTSGRPAEVENIEAMVGSFITTLPVRVRLADEEPFAALLHRVQEQALARTPFEFLPLADIQRLAPVPGPLFDHILVFENYPLDGIAPAGSPVITGVSGFEQHPYAFGLSVIPGPELLCRFSRNPARMAPPRLAALRGRWQALLDRLASTGEEVACAELVRKATPPAATANATAVMAAANETDRPYPRDHTIAQLFGEIAARQPEAVAVVGADGEAWEYRRLDRLSDAVAAGLAGLERGEPVALAMARGPEAMAVILGILKAGGCYLPIDANSPRARTRSMLQTAACRRVIHDRDGAALLPDDPQLRGTPAEELFLAPRQPGPPPAAPRATDPAYIMFTSGSTGEPKGVVVPHRAVLRLVRNNGFLDFTPATRILQAGPLGFDASTLEIWGALANGGRLCCIADQALLSPGGLSAWIRDQGITVAWLTASLCNLLIDEEIALFAPLRVLLTGGEPLSAPHMARLMAAHPALTVLNGYGPTENTTFTTTHRLTPADAATGTIPIGRPIGNTRVHVVRDDGSPAAPGEWGELCAAGDGLALGYLGREELSRAAFVELPPPISERVYRTGDIGRWRADGVLEFQGRRDGQIKLRGYRIELAEIEAALSALAGGGQAAVVMTGAGENRRLRAYVRSAPDAPAALAAALADRLPGYMLPDRIEALAAFPLTKNGKLDRAALAAMALAQAPEEAPAATTDPVEARVATLFTEILARPVTSPGADFFRLGGQSLKAMRLLARLNHCCGVELSLKDVLHHTTVAALAGRIRELGRAPGPAAPAIPRLGDQADYPLASGQERIWFLQRLQPESSVYNVPFAARLPGAIPAALLEQALALLEERHDALRLRVPSTIGSRGLRQRLAPAGALRLEERDCTSAPDPARQVAEEIAAEVARPFRFDDERPLLRAVLLRETAASSVLLVICHHLICDGWSAEIFLADLGRAYAAVKAGASPAWQPQALRYVDYAAWQRQSLADPAGEALRQRWRARMTPLPEPLALPTDRPRPSQRNFAGAVHRFRLASATSREIGRAAEAAATTLFTALAGLVKVFLHRHTGQEDIVIGVPVAGRLRAELEPLLGFFVNTLPLRLRLDPGAGFSDLLAALTETWQQSLADQLYPLEALVDALDLPREASRNPLFDVLVAFEEESWTEARGSAAPELVLRPYPVSQRFSKMDLSFYFRERDARIEVDIEYSTDLFDAATVARFAERFAVLADAALATPDAPIHSLPLMTEAERALVVDRFNATATDAWPLDQNTDQLFRRQVGRDGTAVALRAADATALSFAEFDQRVEALARGLAGQGVTRGDQVGVCFPRSPELLLVIFAVLRIGAAYVPFVPGLPRERVAAMQEDLGSVLMVSDPEEAEDLRRNGARVLTMAELAAGDPAAPLPGARPADPAYVLFTSGSTGRPKGVVIEHRGVANRILWMQSRFPLTTGDVILQKTPVSFDVSVWELFWWSWTGATLALLPPGGEKDPAEIVAAVAANRVTVMHFVPSMLRAFLHYLEREPEAVGRIASLRYVFASGEALTPDLVHRFNRLIHAVNGTELHNLYGPTEATVDVTWWPCSPLADPHSVPIGRPIANTRMYVLDAFGTPCPMGVAGELFISGVQVARGYVNRPELTAERFLADPFRADQRMYRTGDLARWRPDGAIEYLGRTDHQVKVRGFRIELGEVEAALERSRSVAQAVVRVTELAGLPALEAFLLPRDGARLSRAALRRELENFLPEYMIPSLFFQLDALPLNASGKADRKALTGVRLESGAAPPAPAAQAAEEATAPPFSRQIRALWRQVLPEGADFGARENFFEVGGNSMLLLRLHELLEAAWPGVFSLPDLFVAVTVAQQAERLAAAGVEDTAAPHATPRAGADEQPVAVIGMALRLADFDDPDAFWADLLAGVDRTGPLPDQRRRDTSAMLAAIGVQADAGQIRQAAYLDDISGFDCQRFGLAPIDMTLLDPEQRLFLETAFRSLEDGGYGGAALADARVGVFVGASPSQTFKEAVGRTFRERAEQVYVLNVPSNMASRLGYLKNWHGPAELVDTACSSSLKAVHDACQAIRRHECDLAIAGGARVLLTPLRSGKAFTIETSSGQTRTFDADADGVGAGEGAVAFLLKPLSRALADGDAIRAVIRGGAINQDGRSASIAAPNPAAQAEVINAAAEAGGVELASLDFFEAHGTGTALGDPIEIDGLRRAFARQGPGGAATKVPISSVKGNYGHLDATAGAIGMAKAILALEHGWVPRQPHFAKANPRINFAEAPVFVARENHPLAEERRPWRCGVSAFGLSGINVHLILEQAPQRDWPADDGFWLVVPLSAASGDGLRRYVELLLDCLAAHPHWPLAAVAATLTRGREHLPFRLAIAARNAKDFLAELLAWRLAGATAAKAPANGTDQRVEVAGLTGATAAAEARAAFLAGAVPVWPASRPVGRLNLPPVPMERRRCWPQFDLKPRPLRQGLLGEPINAPSGRLHTVPVAADHFWPMAEHRLAGRPTLVGMAILPMLAEAATPLVDGAALRIDHLSWLRPLVAEEVTSACLALQPTDDGWQARLTGQGRDGEWRDYTEAHLRAGDRSEQRIDLAALRAEMSAVPTPTPDRHSLVQVSDRWHCRRRLWRSAAGDRLLALLELADQYHADLEQLPWHPALLDVAASLALDRPGLVPAGCREIRLLHPLPARIFALLRRDIEPTAAATGLVADCLLLDRQGRVLVEMNGLTFVPFAGPRARLHTLRWRPLPAAPAREPGTASILLLGDGEEAEQLAQLLADQGRQWRQAALPTRETEWRRLAADLAAQPVDTLCGLLPATGFAPWPLAGLLKTLLQQGLGRPLQLVLAGRGALAPAEAAAPTGKTAPPQPDAALALGMVLSVGQEEPLLTARYLELAGAVPASAIVAELDAPSQDGPVLLDGHGCSFTRELGPPLTVHDDFSLPPGGTVVFTGGLGAMALTLAESVVAPAGGAVALLHRGAFPPAAEWPALAENGEPLLRERIHHLQTLQAAGVDCRLYSCDVCDHDALRRTLERVRNELGPIHGVVHTAGIAGDGFLINKSPSAFAAVLAPKVDGARHLHDLTLADPLLFFVLAASRTGLTGAPGQSDYAAANAFLDGFAHWRRQQGLPALALDWNTWDRIGMATRTGAAAATASPLPPEQAGPLLRRALASGAAQLVVTMADEILPGDGKRPRSAENTPPELPVAERIMRIWAQGLGYETALAPDDDFYALGGDSITGMQIINRINRELGQSLSLADLFSQSVLGRFIALVVAGGDSTRAEAGLPAAPELPEYPVSWEQLAVLQAAVSATPHTGYNLPQFLRLPEDTDRERLEEALRRLVDRHEILRSRFRHLDTPRPSMEILPELSFTLDRKRLRRLDQASCQALIKPFALGEAPLFRALLLEDEANARALFLDIHHAVADARAIDILLADLAALYQGLPLDRPGLQQKDAAWQQHQEQGGDQDTARAYWLGRFADDLPLLDLPADRYRPPHHTFRGATASFTVPPEWLAPLRALARGQATTTYNVVLSLWNILLGRLARREELVLAVAADGRDREELNRTTGMFVSLLPLRLRFSEEERFSELLHRNHHYHADAMRHRSFNLNRLLTELRVPVMPERTPLAEVTFSYMNFASAAHPDTDLGLERLEVANPACKADLAIFASDTGDHLSFALEYYADLFDAQRMEQLGHHFLTLLGQLLEKGPEQPLHAYSMLTAAEEARSSRSGTMVPTGPRTLVEAIRQQAASRADERATVGPQGSLTWAEFIAGAERVACGLQAAGIKAGDPVGLAVACGPRLPALMLGILLAGAVCRPGQDAPVGPPPLRAIITDQPRSAATPAALPCYQADTLWETTTAAAHHDPPPLPATATAFTVAPRAGHHPVLSHETLLLFAQQGRELGLTGGERVVVAPPPDTVTGLQALWAALLNGNEVYLAPCSGSAADCLALLEEAKAEVLIAADGLARQLCAWQPAALRPLRRLICLGDMATAASRPRALAACCPNLTITAGLSLPDSGLLLTRRQLTETTAPHLRAGKPAANVRLRIVDLHGRPTPPGAWGRILVEGPAGVAHHRLSPPGAMEISGRWRPDGELELLDNGAENSAETMRIHAALLALPLVREAAVLPAPAGGWLAVVATAGDFDPERARAALRRQLPVRLGPIRLAVCQRLPLTPAGGVDYAALAVPPQAGQITTETDASQAALEKMILEIFQELFQRQPLSRHDSFFDLGGHSLLGLQIVNRLAQNCRRRLSIRDLFDYPTPAELAARLAGAGSDTGPIRPAPAAADHRFPLSHAQQRLYVLHHLEGGAVAYNMPFAFAIAGDFDIARCQRALARLCERHEVLRTAFVEKDGRLWQVVLDRCEPAIQVDTLAAGDREQAWRRLRDDAVAPFDLATAPLFRLRVCVLGDDLLLLGLVMHHIIGDGWSMQVLFGELLALYHADVGGTATLPDLTVQYKDYAVWQQELDWRAEAAFWKETLVGAPPRIELPWDRVPPAARKSPAGVCKRRLTDTLLAALRERAAREGVSLATLILTLFAALLYRLTQQNDMVIGVGVAGRERQELEGLLGFFVNILPIRIRLDAETEFAELLAAVNASMLAALERQDYPFDLLVRELAPARGANREALLNVMFEYQRYSDLNDINRTPENGEALTITPLDLDEHAAADAGHGPTAKYDLTLFVQDAPDGCLLRAEFDSEVLEAKSVAAWLAYLENFMGMTTAQEQESNL